MKYATIVALVFATLLLLAACARPAEPLPPPPADQPQGDVVLPPPDLPGGAVSGADVSDTETQGGAAPDMNTPDGAGQEGEQPAYYGEWTVTGQQAVCRVSNLSQEEADAMRGLTVAYGAETFSAPGEEPCANPVYVEETATADALSESFYVSAADLELPDGEVRTLSVENGWGLGSFAILKDADHMLLYLDGVWFAAVRGE